MKPTKKQQEQLDIILAKLQELSSGDPERDHVLADDLLCEALTALGQTELVEAYNTVEKWY